MSRMTAAKPDIEKEHTDLLNERYDLSDRPAPGVTMERGKPLQEGVRVKLAGWDDLERLAAMSPDEIREHELYPKGFYPLPHPNHRGLFVFRTSDSTRSRPGRARPDPVDIDFDLPDPILARFLQPST